MSEHKHVWAQSCGHNRVGTIVWAQSCGHNRVGTIVWAQVCMGTNLWSPYLTYQVGKRLK